MQKKTRTLVFTILRLVSALLFICAILAGCATHPYADKLTDEDTPPEVVSSNNVIAPQILPKSTIAPHPIQELLPDDQSFAALFVNVGKADACILRFGDAAILIDTGSEESVPQLFAGLNALNADKIDAVFITHSHADHLGGLDALAANYDIPVVYSPYYSEADKNGAGKIVKRAEKLGLIHQELKAGDSVSIAGDVSFRVLGPMTLNEDDDNDNSLVLQFSFEGITFLFTGDMQFAEEQALIDAGVALNGDVLKVGNHGNPDATGEAFAALVSPSVAIVSTSTAEDADSANPRVFSALAASKTYVTQDFPIGVLLTLDPQGGVSVSNPAKEPSRLKIVVQSIDAASQTVTIYNAGSADADLSGCLLFCTETGAALRFPDGTSLPAGGRLTVGNGYTLSFPNDDSPLRKKKSNTVELFDSFGNLASRRAD